MVPLQERRDPNADVSPAPYDAWVFAKSLAGHHVNGEVQRVSGAHRELARRLAEADVEDRDRAWDAHLCTLPEAEAGAWIEAVAAVNPDGPAPEDDGWGQPLAFKLPPVEPFPSDVYPLPVARLIRQGAQAIGCPADYFGMTVLAVAGAAIGRSVRLSIKDNYFASPAFYVVNVGKPGDGKSPALSATVKPLWRIDEAAHQTYTEARAEYERSREAYEEAKKNAQRSNRPPKPRRRRSKDEDELDDDDCLEGAALVPTPVPPIRPILRRSIVEDATTEALAPILSDNPRGLLVSRDEFTALIGSLNQYKSGKGADRQFFLSAWSGEPIAVDRKGNVARVPIRVPHPFLCIVGGTPPDMLGEIAESKGREDGFLDRILFTYPDRAPQRSWTDEGIPQDTSTAWAEIVNRLWQRPLSLNEGRECPAVVKFTPEAKALWRDWYNAHHAELNADDFPQSLAGPWAKLEQYAARIALTLHMLWWAADPLRSEVVLPEVGPERMRDIVRLLIYLKSHTRRVREAMKARVRGAEGNDDVQSILRWLLRHRPESFPLRDLTRDLGKTFAKRPRALEEALVWLVNQNCLRRQEAERPQGSRGRTRSSVYLVNPDLIAPQNCQNRPNALPEDDPGDLGDFATHPEGREEVGDDDLPF